MIVDETRHLRSLTLEKAMYRTRRYPKARGKPCSCPVAARPTNHRLPLPALVERAQTSCQISQSQKAVLLFARTQLGPTPPCAYRVAAAPSLGSNWRWGQDRQFEPRETCHLSQREIQPETLA